MILASSTIVFAWQDNDNKFYQVLPPAILLCAIGFWECWIEVENAKGIFNSAFEVKYGIRKLNTENRICASVVLYWAFRHHDVPVGELLQSFGQWNTFKDEGY